MFNDFDGEIFLSHAEYLKVTENRFPGLCVAVDFDAEEVSLVLPVEFTLENP